MLGVGEQFLLFIIFCTLNFYFLPFYFAITCLVVAIAIVVQYCRIDKSYWKNHGIPGPEPNLILGNLKDFGKGMHEYDIECTKKYGATYGSYLFGLYDLCSSDLNILRQVLVKDFNCFTDRQNVLPADPENKHSLMQNMLSVKEGEGWRRVRNLMTPAFTTGKLKLLVPEFNHCAKDLVNVIEKYASEQKEILLKDLMSKFTMSVIARTAFAADVNVFDEEEDLLIKNSRELFDLFRDKKNIGLLFMLMFPTLAQIIEKYTDYTFFASKQNNFFKQALSELFEDRKRDPEASKKYHDFFQLMLNCLEEDNQQIQKFDEDNDIIHEGIAKNVKNKNNISKIEVLSQSFLFLIAGYETTAFTLHMVLYVLSKLPEIQERVREEIFEVVGEKDEVSYEDLMKLQYLSQVLQETLRMYPPTARTNRMCTEEITINGIEFKPRLFGFSVPIYVIHYDEQYYPEPENFDPERFSPEEKSKRDPLTYLPFGYGPRNCIGMRFADLELRVALVHLIKRFNFTPMNNSPDLPVKLNTQFLTQPTQVLYVNAEKI